MFPWRIKMKLPILSTNKNKTGETQIPAQFGEQYRPDLIRRAVLALQSTARQIYGSDQEAGLRHSSTLSKRRRNYRGSYGIGIGRVNRKIHSRRGTRFGWVGAFSPQTVGGHRSHPPKAVKIWAQKINAKENRKAIRSAMGATLSKELVTSRGHQIPAHYPFIIARSFESIAKTQDVEKVLLSLGFESELIRSAQKKVRAGKGKFRGRRYQKKKGILIVVSGPCPLLQAGRNVAGVDVVSARSLNARLLAPGALPGRVTLWTEKALEVIEKEKLFA